MLNPTLLYRMKIDEPTKQKLIESHVIKDQVLCEMQYIDRTDRKTLKEYAALVDVIEFYQQSLWGFPLDQNYHLFWLMPHCYCPQMANELKLPGSPPIYSHNCPIHGDLMAIEFNTTERGVKVGEFVDRYGAQCTIQRSSIATEACIWLGRETDHDGKDVRFGRMHLTPEMAAELWPLLKNFSETGEL